MTENLSHNANKHRRKQSSLSTLKKKNTNVNSAHRLLDSKTVHNWDNLLQGWSRQEQKKKPKPNEKLYLVSYLTALS